MQRAPKLCTYINVIICLAFTEITAKLRLTFDMKVTLVPDFEGKLTCVAMSYLVGKFDVKDFVSMLQHDNATESQKTVLLDRLLKDNGRFACE